MIIYRTKDNDIRIEFWASSTKHPDSVHSYKHDIEKKHFVRNEFYDDELLNVWQWLLYVASTKTWIMHAKEFTQEVLDLYPLVLDGKWQIETK